MATTVKATPRALTKAPRSVSQIQIEVTVSSGHKFMVSKKLLCGYSSVFDVGLTDTNKLHLPDVNNSTFELFQFWLHGQATRAKLVQIPKRQSSNERAPVRITKLLGSPMHFAIDEDVDHNQLQLYDGIRNLKEDGPLLTPSWLRDLNIDIDLSKPSWNSSSTSIAKATFLEHFSNKTFVDLAAFADDFQVSQLSQDLLTVIVELHNLDPSDRGLHWNRNDIARLYRSLRSESPLIRYIIKELATSSGNPILHDDYECEDLPKDFFVDLCRVLASDRRNLEKEVSDCCRFHEHRDQVDVRRCKERQTKDGAFYASLLKACIETEIMMHEVVLQGWAEVMSVPSKRQGVCMI